MLAGTANPGFYSSRAIPGSAGTKRTSTSSLRSKPLSVLIEPDQGLGAVMRPDRRDQDAAGLEPLQQLSGICSIAAVTMMRSKSPAPAGMSKPSPNITSILS